MNLAFTQTTDTDTSLENRRRKKVHGMLLPEQIQ